MEYVLLICCLIGPQGEQVEACFELPPGQGYAYVHGDSTEECQKAAPSERISGMSVRVVQSDAWKGN